MGSRICMNTSCGATSTSQWKKGWALKSGQIADLCSNCGSAFEKLAYCDTFHSEETGWRECSLCNKRLHCGCSASASFIEIQDFGGVWCINCAHSAGCHLIHRDRVLSEAQTQRTFSYGELPNVQVTNKLDGETLSGGSLLSLGNITEGKEPIYMPQPHTEHTNVSRAAQIQLDVKHSMGIVGIGFTNLSQPPAFSKLGDDKLNAGAVKDMHEPQIQPSLNISLSSPTDTQNLNLALPISGGGSVENGEKGRPPRPVCGGGGKENGEKGRPPLPVFGGGGKENGEKRTPPLPVFGGGGKENREKSRLPPLLYQTPGAGQRPRHILPKPPPKTSFSKASEVATTTSNKRSGSRKRKARPPAEGRLRNQLLPRYWPRISDQELQELSGDLNSTIVPLFEKVLSASDASRIGRLVLPKACAEAYFPPINQSEGLPLKIQDVKGNEWTFQFRFWPNNNSRMYVLEGVTPCIQSMQLQAGDTVMFSRIDPGGKLVMGFRKASISVETQGPLASSSHNDVFVPGESSCSDVADSQATANGYSCLLQSMRGSKENNATVISDRPYLNNVDTGWIKNEKITGKINEDSKQQHGSSSDKKRTRNIGSKSKRLLMHSEDALELRISWEETQDLLRPPPSIQPNVIMIDDFEFEEYSEPPVFGKRTLFTIRLSGGQDQWAQCDKCAKWRKLPIDVLLPPKWSCSDNMWDLSRSSCSVPDESGSEELNNLLRAGKDLKKRRVMGRIEVGQGSEEPCGLDALATAAALGDEEEVSAAAAATLTTTRHPRHKPGCSCIVCIQPPSGKGKHKPNCVCNVCSTVKRRFETLMMRKKKRQSEREAEAEMMAQQQPQQQEQKKYNQHYHPTLTPTATAKEEKSHNVCMDIEEGGSSNKDAPEDGEESSGSKETFTTTATAATTSNIDLNCHPNREDELQLQLQADRSVLNIPLGCLSQSQNHRLMHEPNSSSAPASASASASSSVLLQLQQQRIKEQRKSQPSEADQIFQHEEKSGQDNDHQEAVSH